MTDPSTTPDRPVTDTTPCAFDGLEYPSCFMVDVDGVMVYNGNLKEYKQLLKSIAV